MAENMYRALWAWLVCIAVTFVVSSVTKPRPTSELVGLVYGAAQLPIEQYDHWYQRPVLWAVVVAALFIVVNIALW
jgi:SSS family solute:Na+ symporter